MKALFCTIATILLSAPAMAHPGHGGHLKFFGEKLHAHLSWNQGPESGAESKMKLEWRDGATHALLEPGVPFEVSLWMPSMDHGSAPTKIRPVVDAQGQTITGTYEVYNMFFVMHGAWDVRVKIKDANGTEETKIWSVEITGNGHGGHAVH